MTSRFTFSVFFDGQFWVGVLEIHDHEEIRAARHVFGPEPTGPELRAFVLSRAYDRMVHAACLAPAVASSASRPRPNPKRVARQAAREREAMPVTSAAQQAMKTAIEAGKVARRTRSRADREEAAAVRRQKAVAKAKAKHRGR